MKNIYKITKGQLITIWIFGLIGFFASIDQSDYSGFATFLAVLIPALLIFYTIGWRASNKVKEENNKQEFQISNFLPTKRTIIVVAIIGSFILGLFYIADIWKENLEKEQLKQKYDQAISNLDNLKAQFTTCMQPTIDKKYQEELRSCNLLKNKIKANYDTCLTYTLVSPRASCLYDYDYEKIDCSQETMERKAQLASINNVPKQCSDFFGNLMDANDTIKKYSIVNNL